MKVSEPTNLLEINSSCKEIAVIITKNKASIHSKIKSINSSLLFFISHVCLTLFNLFNE